MKGRDMSIDFEKEAEDIGIAINEYKKSLRDDIKYRSRKSAEEIYSELYRAIICSSDGIRVFPSCYSNNCKKSCILSGDKTEFISNIISRNFSYGEE